MKSIVPIHLHLPSVQFQEREYHYDFLKKSLNKEKVLSFDFTLMYNGQTHNESKRSIIKINRRDLLINNQKPDETMVGELLYHSSQALFPLKLTVNSYGYPKDIYNHLDILERWKSFIPRFEAYYESGKAISLLNQVGKIYKNKDNLLKSLRNDLFFSLLFLPIYGDYGIGRVSIINEYEFSFISGHKIKYSLDLEIQKEYTENGKIKISIDGKSELVENNTISGYFLLNKDRSIHEIDVNFYFPDYEEIRIYIFETKEIAERKAGINVVFDEKEEREKRIKSRGIFLEEIENNNLPKHKLK